MSQNVELDRKSLKKPDRFLNMLNHVFSWLRVRAKYAYSFLGVLILAGGCYYAYSQYRQWQEGKATEEYYTLYKDYEKAKTDFKNKPDARAKLEEPINKLRAFIGKFSATFSAFEARLVIAQHFYDYNDAPQSVLNYEAALKNSKTKEQKAFSLYGKAYAEEKDNQPDKAIASFEELIKLDVKPFKADAMLSVGRIYENKGDKQKAAEKYQQIIVEFANSQVAKTAETQKLLLESSVKQN